MAERETEHVLFVGEGLKARGTLEEVAREGWEHHRDGELLRIAIFDGEARVVDVNYDGELEGVLARLPGVVEVKRGPGRPKLGVVSREVTLLPRHWEWLSEQRGGASATLRRLVEEARRGDVGLARRKAREAAYRFMSDMAGGLSGGLLGFEEASRAFFADDDEAFSCLTVDWPRDVREHVEMLMRAGG